MNRISTLIILLFCAVYVSAQSAGGRYVSRMTQDGILYFIEPKKLSKTDGINNFEFDITLLSWTDSATVNFTFKSKSVDYPKELNIKTCERSISVDNYSLLFTDIVKGGYEIRVTSKISINALRDFVSCTTPPVFSFDQDGVSRSATYSDGAWKKDQKKLLDIYNLYQLRK